MKIHVDATKCEGYGTCAEVMPHLLLLDEWGYAYADNDGRVPEGQEKTAQRAMLECPTHAIVAIEP